MSNQLLHKAIRKNPIHLIGKNKILTDELFGIVGLRIENNRLISTTIYNPLNYSKAKAFQSHNESHGTFFYNNHKRSIYIMLNHMKTLDIYIKQDILRKALYFNNNNHSIKLSKHRWIYI